jgi:hypothetical protein
VGQDVSVESLAAPGRGVGFALELALAPLLGERLRYIGRAADLVWVGIGRDVALPERSAGSRALAEHAMHLQCPWRLTMCGDPLVGSSDLYRSPGSNDWADAELAPGASAFDVVAAELTRSADADYHVEVITGNDWGGVSISFGGELLLEVLPVSTASRECWRYFRPGTDDHFIVFEPSDE